MFTPLPNALPPPPQCPSFPLHHSTPAPAPLSIPSTHPCGHNPMSVCPFHSGSELDVGWCVFVYKPCVLGGWKVVVVGTVFGGVGVIAGTRSSHRHACAHWCGHLVVGGERRGQRRNRIHSRRSIQTPTTAHSSTQGAGLGAAPAYAVEEGGSRRQASQRLAQARYNALVRRNVAFGRSAYHVPPLSR